MAAEPLLRAAPWTAASIAAFNGGGAASARSALDCGKHCRLQWRRSRVCAQRLGLRQALPPSMAASIAAFNGGEAASARSALDCGKDCRLGFRRGAPLSY